MPSSEHVNRRLRTIANALIERLQGTCCMTEPKQFNGEHEDKIRELVSEDIFICATCGWWCDRSEEDESDGTDECCIECGELED